MTAFTVAAMPPEPTSEQILANIRRLTRPTEIRFSPAIATRTAIRVKDGDTTVIVCSWEDRDAVIAAVALATDGRYEINERAIA